MPTAWRIPARDALECALGAMRTDAVRFHRARAPLPDGGEPLRRVVQRHRRGQGRAPRKPQGPLRQDTARSLWVLRRLWRLYGGGCLRKRNAWRELPLRRELEARQRAHLKNPGGYRRELQTRAALLQAHDFCRHKRRIRVDSRRAGYRRRSVRGLQVRLFRG